MRCRRGECQDYRDWTTVAPMGVDGGAYHGAREIHPRAGSRQDGKDFSDPVRLNQAESLRAGRSFMKPAVVIGVILIVIGVVSLAYQGITYTTKEKVVDLGPVKVETERERTIPLPPVVGVAALVGGVLIVVLSRR
jgi:hypothetical protein